MLCPRCTSEQRREMQQRRSVFLLLVQGPCTAVKSCCPRMRSLLTVGQTAIRLPCLESLWIMYNYKVALLLFNLPFAESSSLAELKLCTPCTGSSRKRWQSALRARRQRRGRRRP